MMKRQAIYDNTGEFTTPLVNGCRHTFKLTFYKGMVDLLTSSHGHTRVITTDAISLEIERVTEFHGVKQKPVLHDLGVVCARSNHVIVIKRDFTQFSSIQAMKDYLAKHADVYMGKIVQDAKRKLRKQVGIVDGAKHKVDAKATNSRPLTEIVLPSKK